MVHARLAAWSRSDPGDLPSVDLESAQEDREFIARSLLGDEGAFERLVKKYQERTLAIARSFYLDEESARDVAQEAFLRVYRSLHRYDAQQRFYTWFYRIVVHLVIDLVRRRKRAPISSEVVTASLPHPGKEPGACLEEAELREQVGRVLELLPENYRALLVLRDMEGFSSKEISDICGSNHATVRWRLHRARRIFRQAWEAAGLPGAP